MTGIKARTSWREISIQLASLLQLLQPQRYRSRYPLMTKLWSRILRGIKLVRYGIFQHQTLHRKFHCQQQKTNIKVFLLILRQERLSATTTTRGPHPRLDRFIFLQLQTKIFSSKSRRKSPPLQPPLVKRSSFLTY